MFFKNKIEFFSNHIPINFIKNYITIYPKNLPSYFQKIPRLCPFSRKKNVRKCSGFLNYYRRAIVFNSPCDISILHNKEKKQFEASFGDGYLNNDTRLFVHNDEQFLDFMPNKKYFRILKLVFGLYIKTDIPLIISAPWWSSNNLDIVPGVLNAKVPIELNVFLGIKNEQEVINIKQNTPLCVIHTESEKPIKLIFKNNHINAADYNGFQYLFSTLKDRILKNKFTKE